MFFTFFRRWLNATSLGQSSAETTPASKLERQTVKSIWLLSRKVNEISVVIIVMLIFNTSIKGSVTLIQSSWERQVCSGYKLTFYGENKTVPNLLHWYYILLIFYEIKVLPLRVANCFIIIALRTLEWLLHFMEKSSKYNFIIIQCLFSLLRVSAESTVICMSNISFFKY